MSLPHTRQVAVRIVQCSGTDDDFRESSGLSPKLDDEPAVVFRNTLPQYLDSYQMSNHDAQFRVAI